LAAAKGVNKGKAGSWDGISDVLFSLNKSCCRKGTCTKCRNKITAINQLLTPSYWEQPLSHLHFRARLLCLNKVYPLTPLVSEYRPIVVASPIIKFMEGLLLPKLRRYSISKMHSWQFGFTKGVSIDECKAEVIG
jgi:hypothetical protein